jgi:ABC-type amino acid transport substrate-binding protein
VKKGKEFDFTGIEDLYGKRIGIQSGWFVSSQFDEAVSECKILAEETTENESNLQKLHQGRIDAFISNYHISMYTLKKLALLENIVTLPKPVKKKKGVYWTISKKANNIKNKSEFIEKVNKAIEEIHNDGT